MEGQELREMAIFYFKCRKKQRQPTAWKACELGGKNREVLMDLNRFRTEA